MIKVREMEVEGRTNRMVNTNRLSKNEIKDEIYKRMAKRQGIGYEEIKKDDELLHKEILGKYGSYWNLYMEMDMTGNNIISVGTDENEKGKYCTKELVKDEMERRNKEGLSLKIQDIKKSDFNLFKGLRNKTEGIRTVKKELVQEGRINKKDVPEAYNKEWDRETVKEALKERKRKGLKLNSKYIQESDSALMNAISRHTEGLRHLVDEIEQEQKTKGNKKVGKEKVWTTEKIIKEYNKLKEQGLENKISSKYYNLYQAIYRDFNGINNFKKFMHGETYKKDKKMGKTKEEVKREYVQYLEEGNRDSSEYMKKKNSTLLRDIYLKYKSIKDIREEVREEGLYKGNNLKNGKEDYNKRLEKDDDDKDMDIDKILELNKDSRKKDKKDLLEDKELTESKKGVTIKIKNSKNLEDITVDGNLKNINIIFE